MSSGNHINIVHGRDLGDTKVYEGFLTIQSLNDSHGCLAQLITLPEKDLLELPYNGDKKLIMTFQRIGMMSFKPINLKSIILLLVGYHYGFQMQLYNLTTRFKVPLKGPS